MNLTFTAHQPIVIPIQRLFPDEESRWRILSAFKKADLLDYATSVMGYTPPARWTKDTIIENLLAFDGLTICATLGT